MQLSKGDWIQLSHIRKKAEVEKVIEIDGELYYKLEGFTGLYQVKEVMVERVGL